MPGASCHAVTAAQRGAEIALDSVLSWRKRCHPTYFTKELFATYCDDFLVTDNGVERLHKFPEKIFELG
jgi:hypothetical protein